jgi:hypothetical protein
LVQDALASTNTKFGTNYESPKELYSPGGGVAAKHRRYYETRLTI